MTLHYHKAWQSTSKQSTSRQPAPFARQSTRTARTHAALDSLFQFFRPSKPAGKTVAIAKRDQLLGLLLDPAEGLPAADIKQQVDTLIDELAELQLPFKEDDLSGGPGVVLYTRGKKALWDAVQAPFRANSRSAVRASQSLDAPTRTVVSKAEFWSPSLFVTASGSYTPLVDEGGQGALWCPVTVQVDVQQGALHLGDVTIPLPIKGQGQFDVLYCDPVLRIFQSGSTYAVQVKEDYLAADR